MAMLNNQELFDANFHDQNQTCWWLRYRKKRLQFQRENDNNPQDFGMGHVIGNPISELWDAPGLDTPILYILS
jgi:hypothetical protein